MNERVRTAIVYINLVVNGSEAHISRKASQGGGDLWIVGLAHTIRLFPFRKQCCVCRRLFANTS